MPNKYSHAFVVQNYDSYGITNYDRSRPSKPPSSPRSPTVATESSKPITVPSRSYDNQLAPKNSERLRLASSPPEPDLASEPRSSAPRHSRSSSVETQIYAPVSGPIPHTARNGNNQVIAANHRQIPTQPQRTLPKEPGSPLAFRTSYVQAEHSPHETPRKFSKPDAKDAEPPECEWRIVESPQPSPRHPHQANSPSMSTPPQIPSKNVARTFKPEPSPTSTIERGRRRDVAPNLPKISTASWKPSKTRNNLESPAQTPYSSMPHSAGLFAPECPPSPPDTPASGRSFSLSTGMGEPDPMPPPAHIAERIAMHSLPEVSPRRSSTTTSKSSDHGAPLSSSTFDQWKPFPRMTTSTATQTSPERAPCSTPSHSRTTSMGSRRFENGKSGSESTHNSSDAPSMLFAEDDSDLESLPSTIDFNVMPWCDHNAGPAIFREGQLNSPDPDYASTVMTRESSFDSAAPPPIALDRPLPRSFAEIAPPAASRPPKKGIPSVASLSPFRSGPKAILYSQTVPGTPPTPVFVSRTSAPSVPDLFPKYKGQFPPSATASPVRPASRDRRSSSTFRSASKEPHRSNSRSGSIFRSTSREPRRKDSGNDSMIRSTSIEPQRRDGWVGRTTRALSIGAQREEERIKNIMGAPKTEPQVKDRRCPRAGRGRNILRQSSVEAAPRSSSRRRSWFKSD
ncbi:hypothetical protein ACLMJK_007126 [Lecanora helva]